MADGDASSVWEPVAPFWRKVAKDAETESADLQRAATLYLAAEGHMAAGDPEKVMSKAKEALEIFKDVLDGYMPGIGDSVRLLVHAYCLADQRKEAAQLVIQELREQQERPNDSNVTVLRAKLLLASAELNSDGRGNRKRDEALMAAREARELFQSSKDKHMEGMALLMQAFICGKRKGGPDERAQEILKVARDAQPLFKSLNDRRGEALTLHWVGVAFGLKEMYQDAMKAAGEAKVLFRQGGDVVLEARESQILAAWNLKEQDLDRAVRAAAEALRLLKESGYRGDLEASATQTLVQAYVAQGEGKEALRVSQQFLLRAQISLDKRMEVEALLLASQSYLAGGAGTEASPGEDLRGASPCPLEALEAAERALQLSKDIKDDETEARVMRLLATLYQRRQEYEQASAAAKQTVQTVGGKDLESEGAALQQQAGALLAKGDLAAASEKAHSARALFRDNRHPQGEASSLLLIAQIQFEDGLVDKAVLTTKDAQVISQDIEDKRGVGDALMQVAEFRNANNEHARALHAADRARQHVTRYGDKAAEARMWLVAAQNRVFSLVRKSQEAEAEGRKEGYAFKPGWEEVAKATGAAREAVKISEEIGDSRGVGNALCIVAQMYTYMTRFEHALAAADEAIVRFVELGDVRSEAAMLVLQAQIYMAMENYKKSLSLARQGQVLFQQAEDAQGEALAEGVLLSLRSFEFVVDERQGAPMMIAGDQLAVASMAGELAKTTQMSAADVSDTIQKVTRKMVGADDDLSIPADNPLMDIGITSMNAVLFRNKLGNEFEGIDLPSTLVFDYPSIRDLTHLIMERGSR